MFLTEMPHSQPRSARKKEEEENTTVAEGVFKSHPYVAARLKQPFLVLCPTHIQRAEQLPAKASSLKY